MSGALPQTEPMSPIMRNTLTLLHWAVQGLGGAERARRLRLAGRSGQFTGADAMRMYLKDNGIDVPRIEDAIRSLLKNGESAAALRDVATMVADAAADPTDLGKLVQKMAHCCGPTAGPPTAGPSPAAAPSGATWTATWEAGKPLRFRPDLTSAARNQARAAETQTEAPAPAPASNGATAAPPADGAPAAPASNVPPVAGATGTDTSNVPAAAPQAAGEGYRNPQLAALKRELDEFDAYVKRELAELRAWATARIDELSRRVDACEAQQTRMQAEIDRLNARVLQLEIQAVKSAEAERADVVAQPTREPSSNVEVNQPATTTPPAAPEVAPEQQQLEANQPATTAAPEAAPEHQQPEANQPTTTAPEVAPGTAADVVSAGFTSPPDIREGNAAAPEENKTCPKGQDENAAFAAALDAHKRAVLGTVNAAKAEIHQKINALEGTKAP